MLRMRLSVTDGKGAVSLSASIQGDRLDFHPLWLRSDGRHDAGCRRTGQCLAAKLKEQGVTAADADMLATVQMPAG